MINMKKKLMILFLCAILLFTIAYLINIYYWDYDNPLKNHHLSHTLEQKIGTKLTRSHINKITTLDMSKLNIDELNWVKHFRNLSYLNLSHNDISDIQSLAGLNIQSLDLSYNKIEEIPVMELNELLILNVSNNRIENVDNISNLKNIQDLILANNKIDSIKLLQLPNLILLDMSLNKITSIEGIEKVTTLKRLFIGGNNISDMSPILKLDRLEELDISENDKIDMTLPKSFLNKLKRFNADNTNVKTTNK